MEHSITLKDRSSLHISGIEHIYSFNDKKVELRTSAGEMVIEGENLDMGKLSLDEYYNGWGNYKLYSLF